MNNSILRRIAKYLIVFVIFPQFVLAQQSFINSDAYQRYQDARQWFMQENYQLAYPVFKEMEQTLAKNEPINQQLKKEEISFYIIACELMELNTGAENNAQLFLNSHSSQSLKGQLGYYLGMYYFKKQQYPDAIAAFEKSSSENLGQLQIAEMKFAGGYSHFIQKRFSEAKPLFASARQATDSKYYVDANYYYGLILFSEKKYREALECFNIAKASSTYKKLIPYYIAGITYSLGQKEKAISLAEDALQQGNQYYSTQLKQLIGHGYFEKQEYAKALPYLEQYVQESDKVKREDLYELGFCYYIGNELTKAIQKFKPLAGGQDTLSQNAMYMLGDAYLKTNQKINARNAFLFCSTNSSSVHKKEVSAFNYGKLSYELGFDVDALPALKEFINQYPASKYNGEARDLLVNVLANTSNYKEALDLYETIPNKSENTKKQYPKILYNRAQELINDNENEAADKLLDKALAAQANTAVKPLALFWKGELAYSQERFEDAANYYNQYMSAPVANGDVNTSNARYNLAYSLLRLGKYGAAQNEFQNLAEKKSSSTQLEQDVLARLADCYYMQKKFGEAKAIYDKIITGKGYSADYAIFQTGMIEGALNHKQAKLDKLNSLETYYPASILVPDANMEMADVFLADEQFKNALPYLFKIINSKHAESLKPAAYLKTGIAQYNLNKDNEAVNTFTTLLKQYPLTQESEEAIDNLRSIFIEQGKPDKYISFLQSIGKNINENQADSLTYSAIEFQLSEGKKEQALTSLKDYLYKFPNGRYAVLAAYNTAELYKEKNDLLNASANYELVTAKAPNKYAERSILSAARIQYFEFKNYTKASELFQQLKSFATTDENKLEAMRGLVRCQYYGKQYGVAVDNAKELLELRGAGSDDKVFSSLVLGKNAQESNRFTNAIDNYKTVIKFSKANYAAEARYEIANCFFQLNKLEDAEKAAFDVIQKSASYEDWVTKSYLLLGDIYAHQKDYFNAKATYKSVAENATIPELKTEAETKLKKIEVEEQAAEKIGG